MQTQPFDTVNYAEAIVAVVASLPIERQIQIYEYALFLQSRVQDTSPGHSEIEADEAEWEAQFSETDDAALSALIETVQQDIQEGRVMPMFDEQGEFVER